MERMNFRLLRVRKMRKKAILDFQIVTHLHGSEDTGPGGGPGESGVEASPECSGSLVHVVNGENLAVNVGVTLIQRVQLEFLQDLFLDKQQKRVNIGLLASEVNLKQNGK